MQRRLGVRADFLEHADRANAHSLPRRKRRGFEILSHEAVLAVVVLLRAGLEGLLAAGDGAACLVEAVGAPLVVLAGAGRLLGAGGERRGRGGGGGEGRG